MEIFLFLPGLFAFLLFKYFRYDVNFGNSLWFFVLFYFFNCFMPYVLCFVRALVHVQLQFYIKLKDMRKLKDIYDKKCKKNTKILPEFCNNNNSKESEDYCKKSSKMRIIIIAAMRQLHSNDIARKSARWRKKNITQIKPDVTFWEARLQFIAAGSHSHCDNNHHTTTDTNEVKALNYN